jgi:uncharacterized protein (TIGR04255 family)
MNQPFPDFEHPPVIEVALSVGFQTLTAMASAHAGLFWSTIRTKYPKTEDQPPLKVAAEQEGGNFVEPKVQLELMDKPQPRVWFLNESGNELVQMQHDRFIHNWRKVAEGDVYPRYEQIRETFADELAGFDRFVRDEGLGAVIPTQCEVTYVNHIHAGHGWRDHGDIDRVMSVWQRASAAAFLPGPEDVRFAARYPMRDGAGNFCGRLSASVQPARLVQDNSKIMVFTLTARGATQPAGDLRGVMPFMDMAREWIVRGFADLTTEAMHKVWGRRDK